MAPKQIRDKLGQDYKFGADVHLVTNKNMIKLVRQDKETPTIIRYCTGEVKDINNIDFDRIILPMKAIIDAYYNEDLDNYPLDNR